MNISSEIPRKNNNLLYLDKSLPSFLSLLYFLTLSTVNNSNNGIININLTKRLLIINVFSGTKTKRVKRANDLSNFSSCSTVIFKLFNIKLQIIFQTQHHITRLHSVLRRSCRELREIIIVERSGV